MENNIASILFARGIMPDDFISYSTYRAVAEIVKELEKVKKENLELRNKVIEQAIDICKDYEVGWQVADIIEKLNSLKTK